VVVVMPPFSVREAPDALIISIDEATALSDFRSNTFRDALYQAGEDGTTPHVALDLTRVDFLSSSGVAILVGLKRRLEAKQGKLVLFGVQPVVQELLRITRLTQFFLFADDEDAALAVLRSLPSN
jgi:anti-sigma B factor antagonist